MRQYLKAGLLEQMQIHLIPVLLGGGVRLFEDLDPEGIELRRTSSIETPSATHFRFEVVGTGADGALPVMDEVKQVATRREVELLTVPTVRPSGPCRPSRRARMPSCT